MEDVGSIYDDTSGFNVFPVRIISSDGLQNT